jgi:hypothetical protein
MKAMSNAQIAALTADQVTTFTATQSAALSATQLNAMDYTRLVKINPSNLRSVSLAGMTTAKLQALFDTTRAANKTLSLNQWNMLGSSKRAALRDFVSSSKFTVPT